MFSRSAWGAMSPRGRAKMGSVGQVWVHHTAGPSPTAPDAEAAEMRAIQRFHMGTKQWSDIAYSFVVFPSGRVYEGRGWGVVGAHTENWNSRSYGICFAGNFETLVPTDEALAAAGALIRHGLDAGHITGYRIGGHRDTKATVCPGKNLYARLSVIRRASTENPSPENPSPEKPENPVAPPVVRVNAPCTGIAVLPDGTGYYLVTADGGVFAFGAAEYRGRVEYVLPAGRNWTP